MTNKKEAATFYFPYSGTVDMPEPLQKLANDLDGTTANLEQVVAKIREVGWQSITEKPEWEFEVQIINKPFPHIDITIKSTTIRSWRFIYFATSEI